MQAARCFPEASATSPCQAWAKVWATRRADASDASITVGVPSRGTLPALGLKLRTGQTTALGSGRTSSGVAPERCTMTQVGETMAEMPSATSAMSPSVTATTTTWASARAPAASKFRGPGAAQGFTQGTGRSLRAAHHLEDVVAGALPNRRQFTRHLACANEHHAKFSHGLTLCVGGCACARPGTTRGS